MHEALRACCHRAFRGCRAPLAALASVGRSDKQGAVALLERACEREDPGACLNLARLYASGEPEVFLNLARLYVSGKRPSMAQPVSFNARLLPCHLSLLVRKPGAWARSRPCAHCRAEETRVVASRTIPGSRRCAPARKLGLSVRCSWKLWSRLAVAWVHRV